MEGLGHEPGHRDPTFQNPTHVSYIHDEGDQSICPKNQQAKIIEI